MQTLHVRPVLEERRDLLPVLCSELLNEMFELVVLLRSPPVFLGGDCGLRVGRLGSRNLLILQFGYLGGR